jgi:lipopolysaccharide export system permease protein
VNLLDRHIFKSVLLTCAAAVGLFAFVVAVPNVIRDLLGPFLAGQFGAATFARLVALLFPFAISFALPMGILTGVLLTLGRLSADSEITAMRAAGISLARIARPVLILAILGTLLALHVNVESAPWARARFHRELPEAIRANPLGVIVPKTFIRDFKGSVIYVGAREGDVLRDIWVWDLDRQSRVRRLVRAESGRVDYDEATNSLIPTLTRATVEERDPADPEDFGKAPRIVTVGRFEEVRIPLDRYMGQHFVRLKEEWLPYGELQELRTRHATETPPPEKGAEHARAGMRLAMISMEKWTQAAAVLCFALVGVPLGIRVSRRETSANLGLALVLVLGFYLLTVAVKWLDKQPDLRPDLLLWLPHVFFAALGLWLFRRVETR